MISKIGNHDKRPLVQKNLDGEIVGEFLSIAHASRSLKISRRSLSCALSGAQKTAGGYIWEKGSMNLKRLKAGWDEKYLSQLLQENNF